MDGERLLSRSAQLPLFGRPQRLLPDPPPLPVSPPRALAEAASHYCAYLADSGRAIHSVRSIRLDLLGLLDQAGDLPLGSIEAHHLRDHVRWLRTERRNGAASLRRKIATFKSFFRHAIAAGWIVSNPADSLIYPPPVRPPIIALDDSELEAVVAAAAHDLSWHALVLLLCDAGLKRDEVLALRAEDLYLARDPSESRVTVRHASEAKRIRRRSVPLTARAHFATARLLRAPLPGPRIFSISVRGVNFVVETVGRRAEITRLKKLTPEVLRDTFAVRAMRHRIEQESAARSQALGATERDRLSARHDQEVLQLLGLSRNSDMALRYRAAVTGPDQRYGI